ncbi:hypothetical protein [Tengunoibacter tsumagoiensis]|uniref:Uncharacterized protein n=1 Tax=Tengunoibacter tsumagoiensis TaxID=2014871 RepID=A0A402AA55_9CHLR|nr:hypothetical protein [Tengunoibacter tsumagoiensis]GCE15916.1 hypothetical protein KTT_57750 [Tengunoibacter tsumagoiensis]
MKHYYQESQVEEGISNVLLQNRCGNRLTLLFHEQETEIELVYKPHAGRRREFRARNFSNRDNQTTLFAALRLPEITVSMVQNYGYDPFITTIDTKAPIGARNTLTFLNLPEENCFALAARCPLLITVTPHAKFTITDGLLSEKFTDRGEEIVSFLHFPGFEENRFRQLEDGRVVLQLLENDVILLGGEENLYHVQRVVKTLGKLSLPELTDLINRQLAPTLAIAQLTSSDEQLQRIIDLNKRIIYSGLDQGGACFGALNRIYYLIWIRDGSMTTSFMARAGLPEWLGIWTPFLLANPNQKKDAAGIIVEEFLQAVGTRWSKSEDDGLYYAILSLFTLYQTTADAHLLHPSVLDPLLKILNHTIETRYEPSLQLFASDTRGETTLESSPYFGYDIVNGTIEHWVHDSQHQGKTIWKAGSLYHNINMYNVLLMIENLLAQSPFYQTRSVTYVPLARELQTSLKKNFINPEGNYYSSLLFFEDGTQKWDTFAEGDFWEYAWAVSIGPFFPDSITALKSAQMVYQTWPGIRNYGYCPWNTLARTLKEFGMSSTEYHQMLQDEIRDALLQTRKYPLIGALTEYQNDAEGWRALPFSAGSLMFSLSSLLLNSLPQGLAVRANTLITQIEYFQFRASTLNIQQQQGGDQVVEWTLNGQTISGTLQIPEQFLRTGPNTLTVKGGKTYNNWRLYSSNARLFSMTTSATGHTYEFMNSAPSELIVENFGQARSIQATTRQGESINLTTESIPTTSLTRILIDTSGEFLLTVILSS